MRVPFDTRADRHDGPRCPWCGCDCSGVSLTLGAINRAHHEDMIWRDGRRADLTAEPDALVAQCGGCGRGFTVALQAESWSGEPVMRIAALRSQADGWVQKPADCGSLMTSDPALNRSLMTRPEGEA
jgi:hypothetical protein